MPKFDAEYVPSSAMTIFAHPDDAEFSVAGTLARWARGGCAVTMVLCTSGNVGTQDAGLTIQAVAETREREQREAARIIGASDVVFLRHDDCQLQPTLELRRALVRVIRQHQPEVVICNDPTVWLFGHGYVNHPDHRAAGVAALEAVFPCAEMPLLWPETGPSHKVGALYIGWGEERDVWIDVTDTLDTKLSALRAHASQLGDWDPTEMITSWAAEDAHEGVTKRRVADGLPEAVPADASAVAAASFPAYTESFRVMVLHGDDPPPES